MLGLNNWVTSNFCSSSKNCQPAFVDQGKQVSSFVSQTGSFLAVCDGAAQGATCAYSVTMGGWFWFELKHQWHWGMVRPIDTPAEGPRYGNCPLQLLPPPPPTLIHPLLAFSINFLPSLGERWEFILCDHIRRVSKNELSYGFPSPCCRRSRLSNVLEISAAVWNVSFLTLSSHGCLLNNHSKSTSAFYRSHSVSRDEQAQWLCRNSQ